MKPIITSLLDTDLYKYTMSYLYWERWSDVTGTFTFTCRDPWAELCQTIDLHELVAQLDHVRTLTYTTEELNYLLAQGYWSVVGGQRYCAELAQLHLPSVEINGDGSTLVITTTGPLPWVTLWEVWVLAIVSELVARAEMDANGSDYQDHATIGREYLRDKYSALLALPDIKVTDFGTRRRFAREWHEEVALTLRERLPKQFAGTSNVDLARRLNVPCVGTYAHEMEMAYSGIFGAGDPTLHQSPYMMRHDWWDEYRHPLSIALTDTFGTDFFFDTFTAANARMWRGLRHDSGDPYQFAERAIKFYRRLHIDPANKVIVFSDGLKVDTIIGLHTAFSDRIQLAFGWGTNLTHDVGLRNYPLVMKLTSVDGVDVAKLTDDPSKATGTPEAIARARRVFGTS